MAIWEQWAPTFALQRMVDHAKERLAEDKRKWSKVYGPAAAMVLSCERLEWKVFSATHLITDIGEHLHLHLDSPAVILQAGAAAVRRWR